MITKEKLAIEIIARFNGNSRGTPIAKNGFIDGVEWAKSEFSKEKRNSLVWFAEQMESKLAKNDHKGGWGKCDLQYLSMRLTQERKELTEAISSKDAQRIIDECADIANFALMIADKFGKNYGK